MSAGIRLAIQIKNARLRAKQFEDFSAEIPVIGEGRLRGRAISAMQRVTKNPPRYTGDPQHHWPEGKKGERARRWYFAALRDGRVNLPHQYQRSGKYAASWQVEKTDNGYRLHSTYRAAKHLAGTARDPERQYHLHKGRWATLRGAMEEALEGLPKEIQENVTMVAKKRGLK